MEGCQVNAKLMAAPNPHTFMKCASCTTNVKGVGLTCTNPKSAGGFASQNACGSTSMCVTLMSVGSGLGHGIRERGTASLRFILLMWTRNKLSNLIDLFMNNSGALLLKTGDYIIATILRVAILFMFMMELLLKISLTLSRRGQLWFFERGGVALHGARDQVWPSSLMRQCGRYVGAMPRGVSLKRSWVQSSESIKLRSAMWSIGGHGNTSTEVVG